jgi:hypothetical protein
MINLQSQPPELPVRVFIGSSSGKLELAKKIQALLGRAIKADVWDGDLSGQLGNIILDELLLKVSLYDFAIMVLSADDFTTSKGEQKDSPRDNVIFELGMFMGVRGRRRVFPIVVGGELGDLKVPTDLAGNKVLRLDGKLVGDLSYLRKQVAIVKEAITTRAKEAGLSLLPSAALAYGYVNNFLAPVSRHLNSGETRNTVETIAYETFDYDFNIYMPKILEDVSVEYRNLLVQKLKLRPFTVGQKPDPGRPDRSYSFFVKAAAENGRTQFVDYPTTLSASYDVINLALGGDGSLGAREDTKKVMGEQEIRNFAKAVRFILPEVKIKFPHNVKYWWVEETGDE